MQRTGIHHVSALTAAAVANVAFYTQVLGMRLVKKTVNQDDVSSYHLFYGDERGNPGTELTFFDIPILGRTRPGVGSISRLSLRIASTASLPYWQERFRAHGVEHDEVTTEAGRTVLPFRDPEGQRLALVADDGEPGVAGGTPWARSPVPVEHGVIGLGPVRLTVRRSELTARLLLDVLRFRPHGQYERSDGDGRHVVQVFATGPGGSGAEVHIEERHDLPGEGLGYGGVHHLALRVPDDDYEAWLEHLTAYGISTSGPVDRYYFRSIYFRDRNGILFELATDGPGFVTDEPFESLGERLALPPFLEPRRAEIEAQLQPLLTEAPKEAR